MKHKELFSLLDSVQEDQEETVQKKHDRVLILDGLNLFFRNFAMMNMVNPDGVHIGGLGGFFRSLGAMIRQTNPTSVYVVFDGAGSTTNRKNLLSEYKGTRNLQRVTNWEAFDNIEEEHDSKIDQIVRIIQYLKLLPVKTTILDKVEADDIIAVLAEKLVEKHNSTCFIVSSDKDFLQLVTDKIIVYRPMEKEYYTPKTVEEKFGLKPKARVLGYGHAGVRPEVMGIGPIPAVQNLLKNTGLSISDFDVIESNEAFAAQAIAVNRGLDLDPKVVNPNGGAIALGHPVGATGAIITLKALYQLEIINGKRALITMCIGGGQGIALAIERI